MASKLNSLVIKVTEDIENLHPHLASRAIRDFWINDFSRGYIQFVRNRLAADDKDAMALVKDCYIVLLKLLAPVCPFITEHSWQDLRKKNITKEESVHLSKWPKSDKKKIDKKLESRFSLVLKVIEKGLAERDKAGIGLRWPLREIRIFSKENLKDFNEIIKSQLNIKVVKFESPASKGTELDIE